MVEYKLDEKAKRTPAEIYLTTLLADVELLLNTVGQYTTLVRELNLLNRDKKEEEIELTEEQTVTARNLVYQLRTLCLKVYMRCLGLKEVFNYDVQGLKNAYEAIRTDSLFPNEEALLTFTEEVMKLITKNILTSISNVTIGSEWGMEEIN